VLPEDEREGEEGGVETSEEDEEKLAIFREMINQMDLPDLGDQPRAPES
jgi:hypothetical protein